MMMRARMRTAMIMPVQIRLCEENSVVVISIFLVYNHIGGAYLVTTCSRIVSRLEVRKVEVMSIQF